MERNLTTVGLVFGGVSQEHEVSIKSAQAILSALKHDNNLTKFKPICFYIDKRGKWWPNNLSEEVLEKGFVFEHNTAIKSFNFLELTQLVNNTNQIDAWFPILHGPNGEDGTI